MLAEPCRTAVEIAVTALADYLRKNVSELTQVLEEFPTGNLQLKYPSITLTHDDNPPFTNEMPYELAVGNPANVSDPAIKVVWIVGQWDYKVQLDIWTRSVPERDVLFRKVFKVLNPNINPMGLSLQLCGYYKLWARFDVNSFAHVDGEQASQRGEWRTKISLQASLKEALQENSYAITKPIELDLEVLDTVQDINT